jgi:hypothetical protein
LNIEFLNTNKFQKISPMPTPIDIETLDLAQLHQAVKLGNVDAAEKLAAEFSQPMGGLVPAGIDTTRAQRYMWLSTALLQFGEDLKLPNLDRILPLPPTRPPRWDGYPITLVRAAQTLSPCTPEPAFKAKEGRAFIPEGHVLELPAHRIYDGNPVRWRLLINDSATQTGYWQATIATEQGEKNLTDPLYHENCEYFEHQPTFSQKERFSYDFGWIYRGIAVKAPDTRSPQVRSGAVREVAIALSETVRAKVGEPCPQSGVWIARTLRGNTSNPAFNDTLSQAYLQTGQTMPDPTTWPEQSTQGPPPEPQNIVWCLIEPWELNAESFIS